MVSVSYPNTTSGITERTRSAHVLSTAVTSAVSAPRPVRRTLMPSQPLARNASVGLPTWSSSSMIGCKRSLRPLSLSPHVRSTREAIFRCSPERANKSGRIARSYISCNS